MRNDDELIGKVERLSERNEELMKMVEEGETRLEKEKSEWTKKMR